MQSNDSEVVEGIVDEVAFVNEATGFAILRIEVEGRVQLVTAIGSLVGLEPGESVRLFGKFENNAKYGEQLRTVSWVPIQPATLKGIRRYLGSGLVEGIGKVMAERLVEKFGAKTLDVIDNEPHRIREVEGIGKKRAERILEAWGSLRAVREVMVFLASHDIPSAHAARIYRTYGTNAVAVVRGNPYRLAKDIRGIGFLTADKIAHSIGIPRDAPLRVEAGTLFALSTSASDGHTLLPRVELVDKTSELLGVDAQIVDATLETLGQSHRVVLDGDDVYLARLHAAEAGAARALVSIAAERGARTAEDMDAAEAVQDAEAKAGLTLADEQRRAVAAAMTSKLLVITGGPGTGKTTVVNSILSVLDRNERSVLLSAPTGRAAKRLTETTNREAKTLHRLLEYSPKDDCFARNADNPLEANAIIVDESSMIDVELFFDLLDAVPPSAQLFLVGDIDQLPSVGPGRVLSDVIDSGLAEVIRLSRIFRQGTESLIIENAHRVNQGEVPGSAGGPDGDFFTIDKDEPEAVIDTVVRLVTERIPKRFGLDAVDEIQVLTPMNRGLLGTQNLNTRLQQALNPTGDSIRRGQRVFRVGDKVMQLKNDYEREVYNGDVGRIRAIGAENKQLVVMFDGRRVTYSFDDLDALRLAYATSIHKSQGSEYPAVVVVVHTQHYVMLRRNLLYTALTRGRKLVVLIGNRRGLQLSVSNARLNPRYSRLSERLRAGDRT